MNAVDEIEQNAFGIFAPQIRDYFGMSNKMLGLIVGLQMSLHIVAAVPIGYWATKLDRPRMIRISALIWSGFSTLTSFATVLPVLMIARFGAGTGKAAVDPVGKSLLADYYPPTTWNRVFAIHGAANPAGNIIGPLLAGLVAVFAGESETAWRWAFPILTIPTLAAVFAARRLREPGTQIAKGYIASTMTATGAPPELTFWNAVGRVMRIRTFRRQLVGIGVLGFALVGIAAFASVLYQEVFGVDAGGRAIIFGILSTGLLTGQLIGGSVGERVFQKTPAGTVYMVGGGIAANTVILAAGVFLPKLWMVVTLQWLAMTTISAVVAPMNAFMAAICPARLRSLLLSLMAFCIALFGGAFGGLLVGGIRDWTGDIRWGLASLAPFGIIGGLLMSRGGATIKEDMKRVQECDAFGDPLPKPKAAAEPDVESEGDA